MYAIIKKMVSQKDFRKINDLLWEIPKSFRSDMRVPARIYVDGKMLGEIEQDALKQVINVASLPGIQKYSLAMPDIHTGYGFVIGGVAATKIPDGVISPGGIGYDQNCGTRLLTSDYSADDIMDYLENLAVRIQQEVPSGLGQGRSVKLSTSDVDNILEGGVEYLIKQGYGKQNDIENCEAGGRIKEADVSCVSDRAKNRGRDQVGTLGSGNHFCEIQKVDKVFEPDIANIFGLFENQVVIFIHTGSRGLGHQNCTDYLRIMTKAMSKYGIKLPDKELACVPFNSIEGQRFFKAMSAAANYAWANRQMITYYIRKVWQSVLGKGELELLYDVAHNIAKIEKHKVDGKEMELCVHRKGATRAFPPGHQEIPEKYRSVGQPVLLPGSMGTASYILVGTEKGAEAFFSTAHGAGRAMSRRAALRTISGQEVVKNLAGKGIIIKSHSMRGIAEEAPLAYKDIDKIVRVIDQAGLSKKVARLVPLAVIKGE